MDSDSLLWVDGNTNGSVVDIPSGVTCSYNIDKPSFWPPMSVLSGLASGFCERKAMLNPVFATGTTWGANTSNAIVEHCANGFALGSTGNALFATANNASFKCPQKYPASNYMASVDAAITTLITGATTYVKPDGTPYGTNLTAFSGLATAADARADLVAGSSIVRPTSDGHAYQDAGMLLYPAAWAKQRKWLLDELRYTGESVSPVTAGTITYLTRERYPNSDPTEFFNAGTSGTNIVTAVSSAYKTSIELGEFSTISTVAGQYSLNYVGPRLTYSAYVNTYQIKSPDDDAKTNIPYALGFSQDNAVLATNAAIVAYCGEHNYAAENYTVWNEAGATKITGGTATYPVANDGIYVLTDGATTALTGTNKTVSAVSVSSGCTVQVANGVTISRLNLMDGAQLLPASPANNSIYNINIVNWFVNYRDTGGDYMLTTCVYVTGAATGSLDSSYLVNGGTLTIPDNAKTSNVFIEGSTANAGLVTLTPGAVGSNVSGTIIVAGYSLLSANEPANNANRNVGRIVVLAGGTAQLTNVVADYITVHSGGLLNMNGCSAGRLGILDGSTVNISGDSYTSGGLTRFSDIAVGTFQPFIVGATPGWNTFKIITASPAEGETAYVTAIDGSTTTMEAITQDVATHLPAVGGTILSKPTAEVLPKLKGVRMWHNFGVLAVNGGTAAGVTNHYEDFRVRQWPTDPAAT